MFRIVIVILMYHCHKPIYLVNMNVFNLVICGKAVRRRIFCLDYRFINKNSQVE
jgi:hypothetical protein